MAEVVFYEKPGCGGNARQKAMLEQAGHRVIARDLLSEEWTPATLRPFFGNRPVAEWFNRAAPAVKSGEVVPEAMDEAAALAAMVARPLLVRRPLMRVGDRRECGFDTSLVDAWIGLGGAAGQGPMEGCLRPDMPPCPKPWPRRRSRPWRRTAIAAAPQVRR
ncbi:ArsC/Spx/MgsR family protein [Azospirillum picis]|uniref:Nitrogenase-associated protein n=1 Tax=Azospirillum picis TaxID=488438 RepID=A0ABU0MF26_9PROT|nr:ArsC/Spx/MgsR family protein [Azospirillum picis]MBP2298156.1 nitrogenase-associated protein [Azospirillum picis]MDQ0531994.1 nitrogenase-associated protein [Azospirillum picis]